MKQKILVIGLTGGISSGKSTVLREFKKCGAKTLDCDKIAKEVVEHGKTAYNKIVRLFGQKILQKNRKIDRKKLGELVFSKPKKRKLLESIVHPEVIKNLQKEIKLSKSKLLVIDIPLLFEAGLKELVNKTIVVWTPLAQQYTRLRKRDNLSTKEATNRIQSQWSLNKKRQWADFVIDNSKSIDDVQPQVKNLYAILTKND